MEPVIYGIETSTLKFPMPLPFNTLAETKASLSEDDDNVSSVSATSVLCGGRAASTSVHRDFPQMMTVVAARVGLPLPQLLIPKVVSHLWEGIYGPPNPPQVAFVSPAFPDIWQCIEVSWQQPIKSKIPYASLADFFLAESIGPNGDVIYPHAPT